MNLEKIPDSVPTEEILEESMASFVISDVLGVGPLSDNFQPIASYKACDCNSKQRDCSWHNLP